MDKYVLIASILIRMDPNLKELREEIVPDQVTEDDFWRNYFYKVNLTLKEFSLDNDLGQPLSKKAMGENLRKAK